MSAVKLIGTIARQVTCGGLIWLGLAASAWADTTTVEYIHTDALGSPVAVTNASGAVIPSPSQVYNRMVRRFRMGLLMARVSPGMWRTRRPG